MMLCYASASLRNDPILVQLAIRQNPEALRYASIFVRDDLETVLKVVEKKQDTLRFASLRVQRQIQLRRQFLAAPSPPLLMGKRVMEPPVM